MSHAHFHAHDGRPRHVHDHEAGDRATAHAHSTMLHAPPPLIPFEPWFVRWSVASEKVASPPEPIRGSEK